MSFKQQRYNSITYRKNKSMTKYCNFRPLFAPKNGKNALCEALFTISRQRERAERQNIVHHAETDAAQSRKHAHRPASSIATGIRLRSPGSSSPRARTKGRAPGAMQPRGPAVLIRLPHKTTGCFHPAHRKAASPAGRFRPSTHRKKRLRSNKRRRSPAPRTVCQTHCFVPREAAAQGVNRANQPSACASYRT